MLSKDERWRCFIWVLSPCFGWHLNAGVSLQLLEWQGDSISLEAAREFQRLLSGQSHMCAMRFMNYASKNKSPPGTTHFWRSLSQQQQLKSTYGSTVQFSGPNNSIRTLFNNTVSTARVVYILILFNESVSTAQVIYRRIRWEHDDDWKFTALHRAKLWYVT